MGYRYLVLGFLLAAFTVMGLNVTTPAFAETKTIKISHQFPGGTIDEGDFRDRLCRKFAQEVEKRTNGELKFEIYPSGSLVKSKQQFNAMSMGSLDMSLYPLAYSGGQIPETNITLMPALITSYEQGAAWKTAPIGKELTRIVEEKGVKILTWVWQAGGIVSKDKPIIVPDDVKGLKTRGAGKAMDEMLAAAGGAITSIPSNEVYNGLQQGVLDSAVTSSGSLVSFRLYEQAKHVTTARDKSFWYMFEPLLISTATFNSLTPEQQKIVIEVGASMESFAIAEAKKDDEEVAKAYAAGGATVHDMDEAAFQQWRKIAKASAWKSFEEKVKNGKQLIEMAESVK
ncbi:TRAP-type C4-dicarboxylate transport system, periplasmic component [Desulfuromonas soudanensis]|uniref:TRAP-type C4-dicarboxylate transport system, periplasmic component n=1 Tax=Desulfuromonas soudanensis TaxID=1603606 RepID=A0A0M3QEZ9_9BACT|nr:TRAP transporter substrate-binding protein DctP [Desulfuromonas soudanensis]ALC15193.1 TRAP-type C4-dicarboxylate transport system, periplasmic component [Desulfuromonas soudanensis]